MMKYSWLSLLLYILSCCTSPKADNFIDINSLQDGRLIRLHEWYMLAPFYSDSTLPVLTSINQDLFLTYGKSEKEITDINNFISLGEKLSIDDNSLILKKVYMPFYPLDIENSFEIRAPISAYLGCSIESSASAEVILNISAYQSAKFWLNGEEIYTIPWKRGRSKFREDYIPLSLKKGANFLLVKVSVSDKKYVPKHWKLEVDISNIFTARNIYSSCYKKHFIRNSLVKKGDSLKIYTGPFSSEFSDVNIYAKDNNRIVNFQQLLPDKNTGDIKVYLPEKNIDDGIYVCELVTDDNCFKQEFFFGDIDQYYDNLQLEYRKLEHLDAKQILNIEGLLKRVYIKGRRNICDFDDQVEYWNRIRIPSLIQLTLAIESLKKNQRPIDSYFLRGYYSEFWKGNYYYSAYLPPDYKEISKLPVFIIMINTETEVRDWSDHWRNSVANGLTEIMDIADELGCIVAWTDCGGNIKFEEQQLLFKEIIDEINIELPVNMEEIYLVGYCASTNLVLNTLDNYPQILSGCGLVNPDKVNSTYIKEENKEFHHKLAMIYAGHDEIIDELTSLSVYNNLKKVDTSATCFKCDLSSHYNNPSDYMKPLFLDLLFRVKN